MNHQSYQLTNQARLTNTKSDLSDRMPSQETSVPGTNNDPVASITRIFTNQLAIAIPDASTDLIDGGLLDSLAMVSLIAQLEVDFGFTVDFEQLDLEDFRNVSRIAEFVQRNIG